MDNGDAPASAIAQQGRPTLGLYYHLLLLVAASVLPIVLMALLATWSAGRQVRHLVVQQLQATAATLASAADQAISEQARLLPLMDRAQLLPGGNAQLLHSDSPQAGRLLPAAFLHRARQQQTPVVSDLIALPGSSDTWVAISSGGAPGKPRTVLLRPSRDLLDLIPRRRDDQTSLIALVDSQGRLAARSIDAERWLGRQVPSWDVLQAMNTDNGHFQAIAHDGQTMVLTFQKLQLASGWVLAVAEPSARIQTTALTPFRGVLVGAVIAGLLALVISQLLSARILRPVRRLAAHNRRIANGEDSLQRVAASSVTEFEQLRQSLLDAEAALQQRAHDASELALQLEQSQRRYRSIAEAGALIFWEADPHGRVTECAGWSELTGQPAAQALGRQWCRHVHRQDLPLLIRAWQHSIGTAEPLDCEFRIRHAGGHWHWVRIRGTQLGQLGELQWAGVLEDVHARRQAQDRLAWLASHDPLTGLANRACFEERLEQALSRPSGAQSVAVLCLDLDRFKQVNDSLGHPAGDALLCQVAQRLQQQLHSHELVARLGGDEFALLLCAADARQRAGQLAGDLIASIAQPFALDGCPVQIGTSVGIALAGDPALTRQRLMQQADLALYAAKRQGPPHYALFTATMQGQPLS